jgi:50S ribosomal protein L16 3-hydroxylase
MTFSIGMRAPSAAELMLDLVEQLTEPLGEEVRYVDPDLAPAREAHEIDEAAMLRVQRALAPLQQLDGSALREWFGRFITRYRAAQVASRPAREVSTDALMRALREGALLWRHPWSRFAWAGRARAATLFVAGSSHPCSAALAKTLCAQRQLGATELGKITAGDAATLLALVNDGHLVVQNARLRKQR